MVDERRKAERRRYYLKYKERIDEKNMRYYRENRERLLKSFKEYRERNRDSINSKHREYWNRTKEERHKKQKEYYLNNKDYVCGKRKKYHQLNKDKELQYMKQWNKENPELKKKNRRRHRLKGFVPVICNIFPDDIPVDYHHIRTDFPLVIPLPSVTHMFVAGKPIKNHTDFNDNMIKKLFCIDVNLFLQP